MRKRLSERDNPYNVFIALDVDHNGDKRFEQADSDPAVFAVVFPIIQGDQHGHGENLAGVGEVQTMFLDIGLILAFVPFESH
jgi:hypothetical protein